MPGCVLATDADSSRPGDAEDTAFPGSLSASVRDGEASGPKKPAVEADGIWTLGMGACLAESQAGGRGGVGVVGTRGALADT